VNILITGATGFIGSYLLRTLHSQGHKVIAGVHNIKIFNEKNPFVEAMSCDFNVETTPEQWLEKLHDIDVVINAVGIIKETSKQQFKTLHQEAPIALFKACEIIGVTKVINISALGADENANSQFHRSKKIADDFLMTLKLNWTIIYPSIVYGSNAKSMGLFKIMAALPVTPLMSKGEQKIQPIHIDDFCRAINQLVTLITINRVKINFIGPAPITMKNVFIELKQWLGIRKNYFIHLPYSMVLLISKFMPNSTITPETIAMLKHNNIADIEPFIRHFGFTPSSFNESLHQYPAMQQDRWQAKLSLMQPLLKFSIALLWVFTGITSLFIYPRDLSYQLLSLLGITIEYAPLVLASAAIMDIILGLATLLSFRLKLIGLIQISVILCYTILISIFLPEQWLHPFAPIVKNIPIIVATIMMLILHDRQWR